MPAATAQTRGKRVAIVALLAFAAAGVVVAGAAALASPPATFDGGFISADAYPSFVANDHTAYAVRLVAHGLAPDAAYRLRIGFEDPVGTAGADRGLVWNPDSRRWVSPAEGDWMALPAIRADDGGSYGTANDAGWFFIKFGDVRVTGARRLVASLRGAGGGEVLCGSGQPLVTVFDAATAGYWVHDRGAILARDGAVQGAAARVELVDGLPPAARLALQRTEPNLCDDDGDGVDDNEGRLFYATGDTDITGDFRMAVPASPQAWYLYQGEPPLPDASVGQGFGGLRPDTDVALETIGLVEAPGAPLDLLAKSTPAGISLTWGAADADGPCRYFVYRWTDGDPFDPFTPLKTVVTHTPADQLTFIDSDVAAGTRYHYEVRAEDAQTNVGPRSNEATKTTLVPPDLEPTTMVLGRVPSRIPYRGRVVLRVSLSDGSGDPMSGQEVRVARWRVTDPGVWTDVGLADGGGAPGSYRFVARPRVRTYYRFSLAATDVYARTLQSVSLLPRLRSLGAPRGPSWISRGRPFRVDGLAKPRLASGARDVRVQCYLRSGSRWLLKRTLRATSRAYSSYTRYSVRLRLATVGTWRLRAVYPGSGPLAPFAATRSGYRTTVVR